MKAKDSGSRTTISPKDLGADCANCPFAVDGTPPHRPVWGEGASRPLAILVGEAPSHEDVREGAIFVGATGHALNAELQGVNLPRSELYVTNAIKCLPQGKRAAGKMERATKCCRPALLAELLAFDPRTPVLAMGKWAAFALTGRKKRVMKRRGFIEYEWEIPRADPPEDSEDGGAEEVSSDLDG